MCGALDLEAWGRRMAEKIREGGRPPFSNVGCPAPSCSDTALPEIEGLETSGTARAPNQSDADTLLEREPS